MIFTIKSLSSLLIIGKSKDYTTCKQPKCSDFLNRNYGEKCTKHAQSDLEYHHQSIHAQRANIRSSKVHNPLSKEALHLNMIKVARMGFAKPSDFEYNIQPKVIQPVPTLIPNEAVVAALTNQPVTVSTEQNKEPEKIKVTPEMKRKFKESQKAAKEMLDNMILSRKSKKRVIATGDYHKIQTNENRFMQSMHQPNNSENKSTNLIDMEEEDVDIDAFKHLLKPKTTEKVEETVEKTEKTITITKRMKLSDFIKAKSNN